MVPTALCMFSAFARNRRPGPRTCGPVVVIFLLVVGFFSPRPVFAGEPWEKLIATYLTVINGSPKLLGPETGHSPTTLETGPQDQCYVKLPDGREIRVKENSRVAFLAPDQIRVEQGLAGFRLGPGSPRTTILIHPAEFRCREGIVVCKAYPGFFRLAVLKGHAELRLAGGESRPLAAPVEIAGAVQEVSSPFHPLDDLYYAWYWNDPGPR